MRYPYAFVQCRGERGGWSYTGSATATIDPAIFAPPIITVQPTYQIIENGKIVMFTIGAKGLDLRYEWKRDTETISRDSIFYWGNERSATGFYKCIVSNEYGSVMSDSVYLQVKEKGLIDDFSMETPSTSMDSSGHIMKIMTALAMVIGRRPILQQLLRSSMSIIQKNPGMHLATWTICGL